MTYGIWHIFNKHGHDGYQKKRLGQQNWYPRVLKHFYYLIFLYIVKIWFLIFSFVFLGRSLCKIKSGGHSWKKPENSWNFFWLLFRYIHSSVQLNIQKIKFFEILGHPNQGTMKTECRWIRNLLTGPHHTGCILNPPEVKKKDSMESKMLIYASTWT